ncbi:MAG: sensor histidine kinase [Sinomonas sp.]|nr:sensor histidine kinase [Sinomonas sp.]
MAVTTLVVAIYLGLNRPPAYPFPLTVSDAAFALPFVAFAFMGAAVVRTQPRNLDGWAMLALGTLVPSGLALIEIGRQRYGPSGDPTVALAAWYGGQLLLKPGLLAFPFVLALFPDGRFPHARWRWILPPALTVLVLSSVAVLLTPGAVDDGYGPAAPFASAAGAPLATVLNGSAGLAMVAGLILAAGISMFVRHRASDSVVRRQLQAVGFVAILVAAIWITALVAKSLVALPPDLNDLAGVLIGGSAAGLAVTMGLAILRGRLVEPGLLVSRTLAYSVLFAVITAGYILIVITAGVLTGGRLSLPLAGLVTAALALTLQPLRTRALRAADRIVFGKRAEPYQVLADFARWAAHSVPTDTHLDAMARVLAEGTGSRRAEVWVRTTRGRSLLSASGPDLGGDITEAEVWTGGAIAGWLRVIRAPGDVLRPREEQLLDDLAQQAGMVLEQARLMSELRASRQRLVAAQDRERKRLERDLHDGAQQHLLALSARIGQLPQGLAGPLKQDIAAAVDGLRDIARGLYPKLLEAGGLQPALRSLARNLPIPIAVHVSPERLPHEVEIAIYYCCSEALQNIAHHSRARRARLSVTIHQSAVRFEIADDGDGFRIPSDDDPPRQGNGIENMRDRVEALDGTFEIDSAPGRGTTVTGRIPLTRHTPAADRA